MWKGWNLYCTYTSVFRIKIKLFDLGSESCISHVLASSTFVFRYPVRVWVILFRNVFIISIKITRSRCFHEKYRANTLLTINEGNVVTDVWKWIQNRYVREKGFVVGMFFIFWCFCTRIRTRIGANKQLTCTFGSTKQNKNVTQQKKLKKNPTNPFKV